MVLTIGYIQVRTTNMKALYKALLDFQQEVPNIFKNSQGYGYKFADLGEINDIIKPILKKHGLGYVQPIDGSTIRTIVFHTESGESIESSANIPQGVQLKGMNDFQVLGSAITYLRRYSLSSMLGLITDEDADAAGEQVKLSPKERADSRQQVWNDGALARAKTKINKMLDEKGYDTVVAKLAFINSVLKKETITTERDANEVADALENEA
jgi:hypothetical protein